MGPRRQSCSNWDVKTLQMSSGSAHHHFHGQLSPSLSFSFPEIFLVLSLTEVTTPHVVYMLFRTSGAPELTVAGVSIARVCWTSGCHSAQSPRATGELLSDISTSSCHSDCLSSSLHYCPQSWLQPHRTLLQEDHMTHCTDARFDLVTSLPRWMREECHFGAETLRATVWPTFFLPLPWGGQCPITGWPISLAHKEKASGQGCSQTAVDIEDQQDTNLVFANHWGLRCSVTVV